MQFVEIALMAAGVLFLVFAARLSRDEDQTPKAPPPEQPLSNLSHQSAVKLQQSLTALLHELQTLSRDITLDLEEKLAELKELVQIADTKLEELTPNDVENKEVDAQEIQPQMEKVEPAEEFEEDESDLQIIVEDGDTPPNPSNRYQAIYKMADEGLAIDEIAREIQMGKGEIQLILSLRKKD